MTPSGAPHSTFPFGRHDYQIRCRPPGAPREVDIAAWTAAPLRIGDHYTIDRGDRVYDLVVEQVSHTAEGRWRARCLVLDLAWP